MGGGKKGGGGKVSGYAEKGKQNSRDSGWDWDPQWESWSWDDAAWWQDSDWYASGAAKRSHTYKGKGKADKGRKGAEAADSGKAWTSGSAEAAGMYMYPMVPAPFPVVEAVVWKEYLTTDDNTPYYYNIRTGLTQWERPPELDAPKQPEPPIGPRPVAKKAAGAGKAEKGGSGSRDSGNGAEKGKKSPKDKESKESKETGFGPPGCNLFVFHLPDDWADEDLQEHFSAHGNLISAKVMKEIGTARSRGFGFVSYDDRVGSATAIKKMQGFKIMGKRLKVEFKKGEVSDEDAAEMVGKSEQERAKKSGYPDDERLIGYLRAISAKNVLQTLRDESDPKDENEQANAAGEDVNGKDEGSK